MLNQSLPKNQTFTAKYFVATAVFFGVIFATIRGIGTLGPPAYRFVMPVGFILMALMPFIFLDKIHRRRVGLTPANSRWVYGVALLTGMAAALFCHVLGKTLFDTTSANWFVTIRNAYTKIIPAGGQDTQSLFVIATIPALIFSPVGEEIYFRGFLQEALTTRFSYRTSVIGESLFFGVVHLFHHGLSLAGSHFVFQPVSGSIWVLLMFLTACLFAWLKRVSGSIYPAIVAHASFNLTMNVCIFWGLS
ncbi:lysostaphin resistance A-like protein [Spirosoma areae]